MPVGINSCSRISTNDNGVGIYEGMIAHWYDPNWDESTIPEGFVICDGANGTPEMTRGMMPKCSTSSSYSDPSGQAEVDSHKHDVPNTWEDYIETRGTATGGTNWLDVADTATYADTTDPYFYMDENPTHRRFITIMAIDKIEEIPEGLILPWTGSISQIPSGWSLCDGNNSTPNMSDKFIGHAGRDYDLDGDYGKTRKRLDHDHSWGVEDWFEFESESTEPGLISRVKDSTLNKTFEYLPDYYYCAFVMRGTV